MSIKNLCAFIMLLVGTQAMAQAPIITTDSYKAGIYSSFEEFQINSPSIPLTYEMKRVEKGYGFMHADGKVALYRLRIKKKQAAKLGKIFGFSDGKNLYIHPGLVKAGPKTDFYKVELLGPMSYYRSRSCNFVSTGNGPGSNKCKLAHQLLNTSTGNTIEVTKVSLKNLLLNYPDLSEAFKNEKTKKRKLREYIIKYLKMENAESDD